MSEDTSESCFELFEYEGPRVDSTGQRAPPEHPLLVAGWENGRVVWRERSSPGSEERFVTAMVEPARVQRLARELFASLSEWDENEFLAPHTGCHALVVSQGERTISIATCHEAVERNPELVCVNGAVSALLDRPREEVLATESTPYWLAFREAWASMRAGIAAVVEAASRRDPEPCVLETKIVPLLDVSSYTRGSPGSPDGRNVKTNVTSSTPLQRLVDCETNAEAAFVLYEELGVDALFSSPKPVPARQLVVAGWSDGRMLWRTGPPLGMHEQLVSAHVAPQLVDECIRDLALEMSEWKRGHRGALHHGTSRRLVARDGGQRVELSIGGPTDDPSRFREIDPDAAPAGSREGARQIRAYRDSWNVMHARIDELRNQASGPGTDVRPVDRPCWVTR